MIEKFKNIRFGKEGFHSVFFRIKQYGQKLYPSIPLPISKLPLSPKSRIFLRISIFVVIVAAILFFSSIHNRIYEPNASKTTMLYIPTGSNFQQVLSILNNENVLDDYNSFQWVAKRVKYPDLIKPGAYRIEKGWNNRTILRVLRSGSQTPVRVTFNNIRFREDLAGRLSRSLEPDSISFLTLLSSDSLARAYGFTFDSFPCIFIPNTYEFYWTTTPKKFIDRMKREYDRFWNEARRNKAAQLGLTPPEVTILASIVQEETIKSDEKSRISGVYINRLVREWPLQADPTVKFAYKDFTIKRILTKYTEVDSPYNTYKYKGLPPGPINFPNIGSIEAVLNAEKHDYMYFSAKEDFSGYHYFAKTLQEHNRNAAKYRRTLNRNNIMR